MASIVERVTTVPFDRKQIRKDYEEHILPLMPRKVPLLNATLPSNPEDQGYLYIHRPVVEEYVQGTIFEDILKAMPYKNGRATFIHQLPGMTLRFHRDPDNKYHVAIDDGPGAFFVDMENQLTYRVPCDGHMYKLATANHYHTAVNADCKPRTHLVMNPYMFDDDPDAPTVSCSASFDFSNAKKLPDLEIPHCTSSKISNIFFLLHSFLNSSKHQSGTTLIPPSPIIGSIIIAAVFLVILFFKDLWSPKIKWSKPPTCPNPSVIFLDPLAKIVAKVLPWNEFFTHKILVLFGLPIE